jgi:hypothetical protein
MTHAASNPRTKQQSAHLGGHAHIAEPCADPSTSPMPNDRTGIIRALQGRHTHHGT